MSTVHNVYLPLLNIDGGQNWVEGVKNRNGKTKANII